MSWLASYYPPLEKTTVVAVETVKTSSKKEKPETFESKVITHYQPKGEELDLSYIIENKPPRKTIIEYLRNFVETLENSDSD